MNILLINVPSRKGIGGFHLPFGLLYVGSIIERCGYQPKILDPYLYDLELKDFDSGKFERINKTIKDYKPDIIGYGGIATSYSRTKKLSQYIKENYPDVLQVCGGPLASVYDLLLTKTKVDFVFHGETEISLPIFLEKYRQNKSLFDIPGISYLSDDKKIITTPAAEQIANLDTVPFPAYHLVDVNRYLDSTKTWLDANGQLFNNNLQAYTSIMNTIKDKTHYISIVTSRGCTHKCIFCYRHTRGIRQHSPRYIINHVKYLRDKYSIGGFEFCDELFNSSPESVLQFCDLIKEENLDIFYLIGGARVDKMNEKILRRLKETGCIEIGYGQESGSDVILKEYRKGVTVNQNREITALTRSLGIACPVQIVIGSLSETDETIRETIKFLKSVDAFRLSWNYLIPLPQTPIWKYVEEHRLVNDVEKYLDSVAEYGGSPLVNLTKAPDKVWMSWSLVIRKEMNLHYYRKTNLKRYLFYIFLYLFTDTILALVPVKIRKSIPLWAKSWYWVPRV